MAAPMEKSFFCTFIAFISLICHLIVTVNAQTSQATLVPSNVDLNSICSCDLTFGRCDINCCCDTECTENDQKAFSRCDDYFGVDNSQMCIQRKMIYINNSPFVVNQAAADSLFCVYTDNYQQRNQYYQPETVNSTLQFAIYMNRHDIGIWNTSSYPYTFNTTTSAIYRSGDGMLVQFNSNAIGLLGLPTSVNNGNCLDGNPAAFLRDQSSSCTRLVAPLATSCQTAAALNARTFYLNFKMYQKPGFNLVTVGNTEQVDLPLFNDTNLVTVVPGLPVRCVDVNGFEQDCLPINAVPTPEYNSTTGVCDNALAELEYVITYNTDNNTISKADVQFKLRQLKDTDLPLTQTFKIRFLKLGENQTDYTRSGNPGYMYDKPVLAGKRVEETIDGVTRVAVRMNRNPDTWLTMLASTTSGDCQENANSRLPVNFGVNMRSGCTVNVDINNLTDSCQALQDYAKSLLVGQDPPDYVGRYGNTDPNTFGDWVPILTENEPPAAQSSQSEAGVCFNMVLGMHYQILYAKTGMLSNPQPKIIGVMRRFQAPQVLRFSCMGQYCQPSTLGLKQKVEISSSVSFVDVSTKAVPVEMERPVLAVRLPYDFFYPFLSGRAAGLSQTWAGLALAMVLSLAAVMN